MARYTGPVMRLQRRAARDLFLKSPRSKSARKMREGSLPPPGQHGAMSRKPSTYAIQLREKQSLKWMYGVLERPMRAYMARATRYQGVTGTVLLQLLERRLDNVVYRCGFAVTRAGARQLVRHNHIHVNGKRVNIPSYEVRPGDAISVSPKSAQHAGILEAIRYADEDGRKSWITWDAGTMTAVFASVPTRDDLADLPVKEQLIVELYSR